MRKFKVSVGNISPFLIIGELIKADQNFTEFFDSNGKLVSKGFREHVAERARECPLTEKNDFENYYDLKFVQIAFEKRSGQIKFKNEAFWSPNTYFFEVTKCNQYFMYSLSFQTLFDNLFRVNKFNFRGFISQFAIEIPDFKIFGYNEEFSHEKYWEISKVIAQKIEIFTKCSGEKINTYKRYGSFRCKNLKSSEPINLFCNENEPDRIFVVFNIDGMFFFYSYKKKYSVIKPKILRCSKENCNMTFYRPKDQNEHEKICGYREQGIVPTLKSYGAPINPMISLIELGILPERFKTFRKTKFGKYKMILYDLIILSNL
jgi:hypothetical protein